MTTVAEVIKRYDVDLTEEDVAAALASAWNMLPGPDAAPLTEQDASFLAEHAGGNAAEIVSGWDPVAARNSRAKDTLETLTRLLDSTRSIAETATQLGVDRSRISHRLTAMTLYSVRVGSRRRIPTWQVTGGHELPGLATIVPAIPPDAHPLDVQGVMTTAQDELDDRSPTAHLASGGDPRPVAELLSALGRW